MNTHNIRCMSCKVKTKTKNPTLHQTENNRFRIAGGCETCGKNKSQFVSEKLIKQLLKRQERGGYPVPP